MKIHVLQHVPFEGPAMIAAWAVNKGAEVVITHMYESAILLPPESIDLLVVMGGPMSIHDEVDYPWLAQEKAYIRECITSGKRVLGVCLGAQLIAHVLGANVAPHTQKEIGWYPITKNPHPLMTGFAKETTVFHWHGDTFAIPEGAVHLASSEVCTNQMYLWNNQALGLQFHMEMQADHIELLMKGCADELNAGGQSVQTPEAIRDGFTNIEPLKLRLYGLLDRFMA